MYVCTYVCMYVCMYVRTYVRTFVCMYVCMLSTFSNVFSSETTGPIEAKIHTKPPWIGGTKVCSNGHMTKMATMPIYGKNLKKLLLWNQKADDLETWYAALGVPVLPSLFK